MTDFEKNHAGLLVPAKPKVAESFDGWTMVSEEGLYRTFADDKGGIVRRRKMEAAMAQARGIVSGAHDRYDYAEGMHYDTASAVVNLVQAQADGATYTNSTTETSLLPAPAVYTLPGNNGFWYIGKSLRVTAWGEIATGAAPGNLNFRIRYGSATGGVIVADTGAIAMTASIATKFIWSVEVVITCRAIGSGTSGSLFGIGRAAGMTSVTPPVISSMGSAGNATPAAAGVDTTTATTLQLTGLTSAAVAATQIILHAFYLEALN